MFKKLAVSGWIFVLIIVLASSSLARAEPDLPIAPTIVSYQGQVIVSGVPYNGAGYFKFAIVNGAGNASFWSNDGTSTAGSQPIASIQLAVSGGLFNVLLGDTGQNAVNASVFSASDRYLRVWFSANNSAFSLLTPDQKIASVPFALRAQEAANAATLNNQPPTYYLDAGNLTGTLDPARYSAYADLTAEGYLDNSAGGDLLTQSQGDGRYIKPGQANSISKGMLAAGSVNFSNINQNGCGASQVMQWTGSAWACGVQARANNQFLGLASSITQVTTGLWPFDTSIAIGTDGLGLISFVDQTNHVLNVFHCTNAGCTAGNIYTLDNNVNGGHFTSLAIGTDGYGLISFKNTTNNDLKVYHCTNTACSSGTAYTADSLGDVGDASSIAIGADGYGLISYYDNTTGTLRVYHCTNTACSTGNGLNAVSIVGAGMSVYTSITIGTDGFGLIGYHDGNSGYLKVYHCTNADCTSGGATTLDSTGQVGQELSITIGVDGFGLISYYDNSNYDLKVYHCINMSCSSGNSYTLDSAGTVGGYTGITIGTDGLGLISYFDSTNGGIKLFHCINVACSAGTAYTLEANGEDGFYGSITIGPDGFGLVAYGDWTTNLGGLKIAHLQGIKRR